MCKCDVFRCEEQWQQTNISEMPLATRVFGKKVPEMHEDSESQVFGTHKTKISIPKMFQTRVVSMRRFHGGESRFNFPIFSRSRSPFIFGAVLGT